MVEQINPVPGGPAKHIIIIKRSLKPGFAGIDNELYYDAKNTMLYGDAKAVLTKLVEELKSAAA